MIQKLKKYFSSYIMFIQLQYGIRRRILDFYNKWFGKLIAKSLNKYCNKKLSNEEFIFRISLILNIPATIKINIKENEKIVEEANKTINNIYNLLGSGDKHLHPIDWHTDFKTGFKWPPGTFYRDYIQEDIDDESDVKVPRELSRCHHLLKLGIAYRISKKKMFADACVNQIISWIDENPLMYTINWGCTMDVAIRAVNWIWTLGLIIGSDSLDISKIEKIKLSLYQHGWYIFRNPEKALLINGNHYLSDLAGQVHLGLLFNKLDEANLWFEEGKKEFFNEIRMQILPSGMSNERSTNYHRLVLEIILAPLILLRNNGYEIPLDIWYRLEKMFDFTMHILKPDGTSPIIGDQDNGRLLPFGIEGLNDFRYLMSLGALLFNRSDFKKYGDGLNIYCSILGGDDVSERWNRISDMQVELESKAYPDAGIYLLRNNDNYLLFNSTGKGLYPELGNGTHTHSDLFSFELFTHGKNFLIDPGCYVYTSDAERRMLFRSTKMHNTVTVDGLSQNVILKEVLWDFSRDAIPKVLEWKTDETMDIVIATHNGYARLPEPVFHKRSIVYDKINEKWIINDFISGKGYHTVEWFFHFDEGLDFEIRDYHVITKCEDNQNITIQFENNSSLVLKKDRSYLSKSYGHISEGNVLIASIDATVPINLKIEIY